MDGLALTSALQRFQARRPAARRELFALWRRPSRDHASKFMTGSKITAKPAAVDPAELIERVASHADREAFAGLFYLYEQLYDWGLTSYGNSAGAYYGAAYSAASWPWPSRRSSASRSASAASAITVPGGKMASAPAFLRAS